MTVIATGVNKKLSMKRQTAQGTYTPLSGGEYLRRVTSSLDKKKATYASNEIRPSQQVVDFRHGVVTVDGTVSGELSVGGYQDFMESICRQNVVTAVASTSRTDIVSASTTGAMGTMTTTAGQFVSEGLRPGMVVRATGFTTTATGQNSTNMLIIGINATGKTLTVLRLDGSAVLPKTETGAVVFTEVGKHTYAPQSAQTRDYYMIEHWYSDIAQSELYKDCVISQMDVNLPASGLATVNFNVMGLDMTPGVAQALTTPSAAPNGAILAAASGALVVNGVPLGLITGMNFSVKGGHSTIGGVVGSNAEPDVFPGTITVDGQATVLFQDATVRDMFLNETEVTVIAAFTSNSTSATADFITFTFPRVKFGGASKDDGNKGLVMTMPFTAIENLASNEKGFQTTFMVQDSLFV
jgi:hypothetical protein